MQSGVAGLLREAKKTSICCLFGRYDDSAKCCVWVLPYDNKFLAAVQQTSISNFILGCSGPAGCVGIEPNHFLRSCSSAESDPTGCGRHEKGRSDRRCGQN
jgi:hypothetical protein